MKIIFLLFVLALTEETSITFEISDLSFYREIRGSGLCKQSYTKIILKNQDLKKIKLIEPVPYTWFVDKEEIPGHLKPEFNTLIDIEMPSSISKDHVFSLNLEFDREIEFSYPIHMRYNDPSYEEPYKTLSLPGPEIKIGGKSYATNEEFKVEVPIGQTKHIPIVVMGTIIVELIGVICVLISANKFTHHFKHD